MVPELREDMDFVTLSQSLHERHCISLSPASRCREIPTQNRNLQANVEVNAS
jgi:hypothetical protein